MDFDQFAAEYNDLMSDVLSSEYRSFSMRLQDWLDFVDQSPPSRATVKRLGETVNFYDWYNAALTTRGGSVGSGRLDWARDRTERLGQQLGLVRHLAVKEMAFADFSTDFMWAGSKFNDSVAMINDQIIRPFARDLLKHIERAGASADEVPASDRIVTLDHNSPDVANLMEQIGLVKEAMTSSNSLRVEKDFERNLAEISAGRRL